MIPIVLIRRASLEAQHALDVMYAEGDPPPGSALDQPGLRDGSVIVDNYLLRGEYELAIEHIEYMVRGPQIKLSATAMNCLERVAKELGIDLSI
jgi:hypothetical protein